MGSLITGALFLLVPRMAAIVQTLRIGAEERRYLRKARVCEERSRHLTHRFEQDPANKLTDLMH